MPDRVELKNMAKEQIKGNIGILFIVLLLTALITGTAIGSIATPVINIGVCLIYINMTKGIKPSVLDMFNRIDTFLKALWLAIVTGFFTMLWSFLLIIPGIIKGLSYSMGPYIMAEHPEWTAMQCLEESKRIMRGNILSLFILQLSFLPWALLVTVTFGIASVYVVPYVSATTANFYNAIKQGS